MRSDPDERAVSDAVIPRTRTALVKGRFSVDSRLSYEVSINTVP